MSLGWYQLSSWAPARVVPPGSQESCCDGARNAGWCNHISSSGVGVRKSIFYRLLSGFSNLLLFAKVRSVVTLVSDLAKNES